MRMSATPIRKSWQTMRMALPAPRADKGPYMPDTTKAIASARVRSIPNS